MLGQSSTRTGGLSGNGTSGRNPGAVAAAAAAAALTPAALPGCSGLFVGSGTGGPSENLVPCGGCLVGNGPAPYGTCRVCVTGFAGTGSFGCTAAVAVAGCVAGFSAAAPASAENGDFGTGGTPGISSNFASAFLRAMCEIPYPEITEGPTAHSQLSGVNPVQTSQSRTAPQCQRTDYRTVL